MREDIVQIWYKVKKIKLEKSMKIITVCGSLKFKDEMMKITEKMELQGNCMISVIYPTNENKDYYTDEQADILDKMHKEKKKMSDAILVVNVWWLYRK